MTDTRYKFHGVLWINEKDTPARYELDGMSSMDKGQWYEFNGMSPMV